MGKPKRVKMRDKLNNEETDHLGSLTGIIGHGSYYIGVHRSG